MRLARRSVIFLYATAAFALFAGFGLAGPSKAQEIQDVSSVRQMAIGLSAPDELKRAKRRSAKKGEWPVMMMAAGADRPMAI